MGVFKIVILAGGCLALLSPHAAQAVSHGAKRTTVSEIVIHTIGGPTCLNNSVVFTSANGTAEFWKESFAKSKDTSIHYIVDRAGAVAKGVPEDEVAWHALSHNQASIGIELVNKGDGKEEFTGPQIVALIALLKDIRTRYPVPIDRLKGHEQVDSTTFTCGGQTVKRKQDPGPLFPWARVKAALQ